MLLFPGLPDTVLRKAAAMSQEFEGTYGNKLGATHRWEDKASLIIENLIKITATAESKNIDLLTSLQSRASLLLQQ